MPGFTALALAARVLGIPADPIALAHDLGHPLAQPVTPGDLLRAAKRLELKAKSVTAVWAKLHPYHLPAVARHRDGAFFVIARITLEDEKVMVLDPRLGRPNILTRPEFEAIWDGTVILLTRRAKASEERSRFDWHWFVPALIKHRHLFGEVLVASFFIQLLALATPLFFQVVIDKVLVHHSLTTLDVLAIALLAIAAFEVVLSGLRTYVFSHTTQRVDVTLGAKLFQHLLRLPLAYFQARRVGDSVARVRELENIRQFITGSALTVVIDLLFTVVFLAVMYYYAPALTWIVLASIPAYAALSFVITPVLRQRVDEKFQRGAENQAFLVETVTGVETLKAMAVEPPMQRRWEEQLAGYVQASFRAGHLGNLTQQIAAFINKLVTVATLWLGAHLVIDGALSIGGLIAFNMLAARVSSPVLRLVQLWQDFQQARISVDRLGDILNTTTEPGFNPNRALLPSLQGHIQLQSVTFRYRPDASEVLRRVDLDIPAGQVLGIVGRSGSGKSTLTKLIQRLYVPESGRVLVDGVDLALVEPAWLRRQIGVVLQESMLFNHSVRENIALADPGLPMDAVIAAAQLAGAHEFILELPEGYDTFVGEHGGRLSGGQRQRLAIARALVTNPRILIFDEATSALDYESERVIQTNLRAIAHGRTVIIIAHRLSSVRDADRLVVLDKGELVEEGTHTDLVQRAGTYARLWHAQIRRNDDAA